MHLHRTVNNQFLPMRISLNKTLMIEAMQISKVRLAVIVHIAKSHARYAFFHGVEETQIPFHLHVFFSAMPSPSSPNMTSKRKSSPSKSTSHSQVRYKLCSMEPKKSKLFKDYSDRNSNAIH